MRGQLFINDSDAYIHGICMGDKFLDAIKQPLQLKEFIKNESRLEDGVRYIVKNAKKASRSLTLTFCIFGNSPSDYEDNKAWLEEQLYRGKLTLRIPSLRKQTYELVYFGKSITYAEDLGHTSGKITCAFEEPNPTI